MVISIIKDKISEFVKHLKTSNQADEPLMFWETQYHFQKSWDIGNQDLLSMYSSSLQNTQTKRYWKREQFTPKESMELLIAFDPEFVRMMFNDLFNEEKDLSSRIDRFIYYCDDLLSRYKSETKAKINNHYHNVEFVYFYLAMRYPENYAVYNHVDFKDTLQVFKAVNIPEVIDPDRFAKTSKIINKFLPEDINSIINRKLNNPLFFSDKSLLPITYFCYYCSRNF